MQTAQVRRRYVFLFQLQSLESWRSMYGNSCSLFEWHRFLSRFSVAATLVCAFYRYTRRFRQHLIAWYRSGPKSCSPDVKQFSTKTTSMMSQSTKHTDDLPCSYHSPNVLRSTIESWWLSKCRRVFSDLLLNFSSSTALWSFVQRTS